LCLLGPVEHSENTWFVKYKKIYHQFFYEWWQLLAGDAINFRFQKGNLQESIKTTFHAVFKNLLLLIYSKMQQR
jgi:hypothetical protein